jgi:hypothetical protein
MALDPQILAMAMQILDDAKRRQQPVTLPKTPFNARPNVDYSSPDWAVNAAKLPANPFGGPPVSLGLGGTVTGPGQVTTYTPGQGDLKMEGGYETSSGAPMFTMQQYFRGDAPYVTLASRPNSPLKGQDLSLTLANGQVIPGRVTDTGPGVKTLDVASSDPAHATNAPSAFDQVAIAPTTTQAILDAVRRGTGTNVPPAGGYPKPGQVQPPNPMTQALAQRDKQGGCGCGGGQGGA